MASPLGREMSPEGDLRPGLSSLWLAPTYPSAADTFGGIFTQTQARAVSRQGVAVTVVAPAPWAPWPLDRLRPRWRRYAGSPRTSWDGDVRIHRPRWLAVPGDPAWLLPDRQTEALVRRETRGQQFSIVHGHFATPHGLVAVRLGARSHNPVVVTLHGSDVNLQAATQRGLDQLRAVVGGADAVIAVSQALAERTEALTGRRPRVLPTGIELEPMRAARLAPEAARARVGWPAAGSIVTFIGRLMATKGVRELVEAAAALPPDAIVVLIGDGPLRGELAASAAVSAGRVRLLGAVAHERIPAFLAASSLVVLPSYAEGLPTVLVEAGAMGVPVVASAVGGVPELLGEAGGWLCPPTDAEALAAAIVAALEDPVEAARRSSNLERTVREHHDADVQAARLVEIYRSLVR
ncbi:MAG: glycosyltransferase [Candidatus Limnocylindrales bacterium]